jgi:hypothetical protein
MLIIFSFLIDMTSPNLCSGSSSCQPMKKNQNSKTSTYIYVLIVTGVVVGGLVVLLLFVVRRKQGETKRDFWH